MHKVAFQLMLEFCQSLMINSKGHRLKKAIFIQLNILKLTLSRDIFQQIKLLHQRGK